MEWDTIYILVYEKERVMNREKGQLQYASVSE